MRPVRKDDNLTTLPVLLSWNLGALTSWNPLGHSRPVMGMLYFLPVYSFISLVIKYIIAELIVASAYLNKALVHNIQFF